MSKELTVSGEAYTALVEELLALKTEQGYDMAVRGLEWSHTWGKTIRDFYPKDQHPLGTNNKDSLTKALNRLGVDVGRTPRMLWMYVKLYDTYPDLGKALEEHGKNVSMRKLLDVPGASQKDGEEFLERLVKALEKFMAEYEESEQVEAVIEIVKRKM